MTQGPLSRLAVALENNDKPLRELIDTHLMHGDAVRCAIFARCWPDDLPRRSSVEISIRRGESLEDARSRLGLLWNPLWLIDAGFLPSDAAGVNLGDGAPATVGGRVSWSPDVFLPRVDDGAPATPQPDHALREARIVAGEVAVAALWADLARFNGLSTDDVDTGLSARGANRAGQARGARFNGAIAYYLERILPHWRIETQVNIRDVFGLHLRKDVVKRSADVVIIGPSGKIMSFLSAKFSWRSDRGTEAAQMVYLQRYRPDLPYVLMTAEFPRALNDMANESIEDQVFHLCGGWVGAWQLTQELPDAGSTFPNLDDLATAGVERVPNGQLQGFDELISALETAASYL